VRVKYEMIVFMWFPYVPTIIILHRHSVTHPHTHTHTHTTHIHTH
jgi:hypothetical protein